MNPFASPVTRVAAAAIVLAVAGSVPVAVATGLDGPEVAATALIGVVGVFAVLFDVTGGVGAAIGAAAVYAVARNAGGHLPGGASTPWLVLAHAIGFLGVGVTLAFAARVWRAGERAAEDAYVDPVTGLFNARYFVLESDAQLARAKRYDRVFSVVMMDIPTGPIEALGGRAKARLLGELGEHLYGSVRSTDRVAIAADRTRYRLAVILPETSNEGAKVFAERMADRIGAFLFSYHAGIPHPSPATVTLPGDEARFTNMRAEFLAVSKAAG